MADEYHIIEEIHIEATPEQIWSVLMDYDRLHEWSNGFLGTDAPMVEGEVSTAYFYNPLTHGKMPFTHTVLVFKPNRSFGWSGDIGNGRHDHHIYELESQPDGRTLFRQKDGIFGKPSGMMTQIAEHEIASSYKSFNKRLKERVETASDG